MGIEVPVAREVETTPVQLTRIEGAIGLVDYKVTNIIKKQETMEANVSKLQQDVHELQLKETERQATAKTVAEALRAREDDDLRKDTAKWTPYQRIISVLLALSSIGMFIIAFHK